MTITRRRALAGLSAATALSSVRSSRANSAVSVGILGTGGRGRYVGGLFVNDGRARIAALCDVFPDQIDRAKTQIPSAATAPVFKDYRDLLAHPGLDVILIATPVWLHPEHFEAAVRANRHIYCEKPAAADVAGTKRLVRAAREADPAKVIVFGFQQRFSPEYLAAEKILRGGELGDLLLMRSEWILGGARLAPFDSPFPPGEQKIRHWSAFKETSGDFIVEQDCHGLDVLNWFAQAHPVSAVGAGGRRARAFGDNTDHLNLTYHYPGGLCGYLTATQLAVKRYWDVAEQFYGSEGILETTRTSYKWHRGENDEVLVKSKREITNDAVALFLDEVLAGKRRNMAFDAADATFTALLGRMAVEQKRQVTWDEMLASA
ncbi:MAG: Gfo/Idh/MocA family oxidoreductase [Bryobacterales bacterium]|nr:Gfo/Idh/MocA family oxidoreductase [Bryobacterales bacterium]